MLAVTNQDKLRIERLLLGGVDALYDLGMTADAVTEFLNRPEIKRALESLSVELNQSDSLNAITKRQALRNLARLVPDSLQVMRSALAGPEYIEVADSVDADGNMTTNIAVGANGKPLLRRPEPTRNQVTVALDILDRLGIGGKERASDRTASVNINLFTNRDGIEDVSIELSPDTKLDHEKSLSREKIRNVIVAMTERLGEMRDSDKAQALMASMRDGPRQETDNREVVVDAVVSKPKKKATVKKKKSPAKKKATVKKKTKPTAKKKPITKRKSTKKSIVKKPKKNGKKTPKKDSQ